MSAALDHVYRYPFASQVTGDQLRLAPDVPSGPWFFHGRLAEPRCVAQQVLVLLDVVRTRFYQPTLPSQLDPVFTANDGVLRLEGFSSCGSVYARIDLPEEAVEATIGRRGTTNVDLNAPMRAALNRIRATDRVDLAVGADGVELATSAETVIERKVKLPVRWIRGFTETTAVQPRMRVVHRVDGADALRLLRELPRSGTGEVHVVAAGRGLRVSRVPSPDGVPLRGVARLRLLERLAPEARALTVSLDDRTGATGWTLTTATTRLTLLLSPDTNRGFSGEGQVLEDLATDGWQRALSPVTAALRWQSRLDPGAVAAEAHLSESEVRGALAALGSRGLVGYDAVEGAWFHRELPFDLDRRAPFEGVFHPRLAGARALVSEGAVRIVERSEDRVVAWVRGTDTEHHVRLEPAGDVCTCTWWAKHRGARGPCRHVLAVRAETGG